MQLRADGPSCVRPSPAALAKRPVPRTPHGATGHGHTSAHQSTAHQQAAGLADTLDRFWQARGVADPAHRQRLVEAGEASLRADADPSGSTTAVPTPCTDDSHLPGLAATWAPLEGPAAARVAAVSRRIASLRQLLGGQDDIDVVWMVTREPALLSADQGALARRLLHLRTAPAAAGLDVVKLVEAQPALLLPQGDEAAGGGGGGEEEESVGQRQLAWEHGLLGDGDEEWARRLRELEGYRERHGDAHAGCRQGPADAALGRWAALQRRAARAGTLAPRRAELLRAAGFEFDGERAEWLRWYNELAAFHAANGHCAPAPLAAGSDFLLLNWCAVQRIARRSGRLARDRAELMDAIGFDWTGADALS